MLDGDGVVAVRAALDAGDAGRHLALAHDGGGAVGDDACAHGGIQSVDVLGVDGGRRDAVPLERFLEDVPGCAHSVC